VRIALLIALALVVAFAAITWLALESGGVAVVETQAADGSRRATHVWFAEPEGELWLEAGSAQNKWYEDLRRSPRLVFRADGRSAEYVATPFEDPAARARVRALLREKYGLRDRWVGLFVDQSRSLVVRLDPPDRDAAGR
jgi:hypothetical protein